MKKALRILAVLLIIGSYALCALPVSAISSAPAPLQINAVNVYENVLELGDLAFATCFALGYGTTPSEIITDTYNVRLFCNGTEVYSLAPFAYYNHGFSDGTSSNTSGMVWMYFSSADLATYGLTDFLTQLQGTTYIYYMHLDGNPTATWSIATVPMASPRLIVASDYLDTTTLSQTSGLINTFILNTATTISNTWGDTSYTLYSQTTQNGKRLSNNGMEYFGNIVPNLQTICPDISYSTSQPQDIIPLIPSPHAYADTMAADFNYYSDTQTCAVVKNSTQVTGVFTVSADHSYEKGARLLMPDGVIYDVKYIYPTYITMYQPYNGATSGTASVTLYFYDSTIGNNYPMVAPPFDLTMAANALHVPAMIFGIVICVGIVIFVMVHGCKEANSYKPAILITIPLLYLFTRIGWFNMGITVAIGLFAALGIWYVFFYSQTNQ